MALTNFMLLPKSDLFYFKQLFKVIWVSNYSSNIGIEHRKLDIAHNW